MLLTKSKIYESMLFSGIIINNGNIKNKVWGWDTERSDDNNEDMLKYFISNPEHLEEGTFWATYEGYKKFIFLFVLKSREINTSSLMCTAAKGGRADIVDFFAVKETFWELAMRFAIQGGHENLVHFFISKGACWWGCGVVDAIYDDNERLLHFFISQGFNNWYEGLVQAKRKGREKFIRFFQEKLDEENGI